MLKTTPAADPIGSPAPLPFEDALASFVVAASRRLQTCAGAALLHISDTALAQLERYLLARLTSSANQALRMEFAAFQMREVSPLERALLRSADPPGRTLYLKFVRQLQEDGFQAFFREYASLASLLEHLTDAWVEACGEFLQRLASDREELQSACGCARDPGLVAEILTGLSDPHAGGKTVLLLTFEDGSKVLYKPRSLGLEAAWFGLLATINASGPMLPFLIARVVDRGSYGWMQHVDSTDCRGVDEARRYCARAGMLLALVYGLNGGDMHLRNVIAQGDQPVLVDLECILSPVESSPGPGIDALVDNSVLRTGMLPEWSFRDGALQPFDAGGFGAEAAPGNGARPGSWVHVNTDNLRTFVPPEDTVPDHAGEAATDPRSLFLHTEEFLGGFRWMHRFLSAQRDALLSASGPLRAFQIQPVRYLARSTEVYWSILMGLRDPAALRDPQDRSKHCEALAGNATGLVASEELASLLGDDIPVFYARADSRDLACGRYGVLANFFRASAFESAAERLRSLSPGDEARQLEFIRGAFCSHLAHHKPPAGSAQPGTPGPLPPQGTPDLISAARAIAADILDRAVTSTEGHWVWIAPQYVPEADRYRFRPVNDGLYDGRVGIAVFFAALAKVTGEAGLRAAARRAVTAVGVIQSEELGIGGGMGWGSIAYGFVKLADLTESPEYLDRALAACSSITPDLIKNDSALDVLSGSAGAILGLLAVHRATHLDWLLERAVRCGEHLTATLAPAPHGGSSWRHPTGKFLTGFAHGAAGIAFALDRLAAASQDTRFRNTAAEAIRFEDAVFSPEAGNWPDFRREQQPAFSRSWCAGAPGIGLARIGMEMDGPTLRRDIDTAITSTLQAGVGALDQLCCGNMGRVDLLLEAARSTARPELVQGARDLAGAVAERAHRSPGYALHHAIPPGENPNPCLFSGTAGIGYELLRVGHPGELPSLLLWQ